MTFNCYGFRHDGKNGVRLTTDELPGSFPLEGMDIICFQEFPPTPWQLFCRLHQSQQPLEAHCIPAGGVGFFPAFPIKAQDTLFSQPGQRLSIRRPGN